MYDGDGGSRVTDNSPQIHESWNLYLASFVRERVLWGEAFRLHFAYNHVRLSNVYLASIVRVRTGLVRDTFRVHF